MSFGDAFGYPFKNLPKLLTIVIVFTIVIAILVGFAFQSPFSHGIELLYWGTFLAYGLFLSGYGVRVIRHVQEGNYDKMPSIKLFSDIARGVVMLLSALITFIPSILFVACVASFFITKTYAPGYNFQSSIDSSSILMLIMLLPVLAYLLCGYAVGMIRYALEDRASTMFQFKTNFRYIHQNSSAAMAFIGYYILFAIIYGILSHLEGLAFDSALQNNFGAEQMIILIIVTIGLLGTITVGLFQQLGVLHLVAQFGEKIGISRNDDEKVKY